MQYFLLNIGLFGSLSALLFGIYQLRRKQVSKTRQFYDGKIF